MSLQKNANIKNESKILFLRPTAKTPRKHFGRNILIEKSENILS